MAVLGIYTVGRERKSQKAKKLAENVEIQYKCPTDSDIIDIKFTIE